MKKWILYRIIYKRNVVQQVDFLVDSHIFLNILRRQSVFIQGIPCFRFYLLLHSTGALTEILPTNSGNGLAVVSCSSMQGRLQASLDQMGTARAAGKVRGWMQVAHATISHVSPERKIKEEKSTW
jgi:hypothetical protein